MAVKLLFFLLTLTQINVESVTCNGDCDCSSVDPEKTCKLKCKSKDICKDSTLTCRDGEPCEIHCDGANSCEGNTLIDGSGATDVSVYCDGDDSCKGNTVIRCGTGACSIWCESSSSCSDLRVDADDASMVICDGSCGESKISPFIAPTKAPTPSPTRKPTKSPTTTTTAKPTRKPTVKPTQSPTTSPSEAPSIEPTSAPTTSPTMEPTVDPIDVDNGFDVDDDVNQTPSPETPTESDLDTLSPTISNMETPTETPTVAPTMAPSVSTKTLTVPTTPTLQMENEQELVVQGVASQNVIESVDNGDAATFYVFIACGVLIIFGAVICCFGIFVHFATKRNNLKYGHCQNQSRSVLQHHGLHGPPAPAKPALANVRTMSNDSQFGAVAGHYSVNKVPSPEPDGFAMDIFTAPTGPHNPILQEKVGDLKVESNGDPELDDIVSPRMSLPPNVAVHIDGNESDSSAPESDGDDEWDLTSCSTSTATAPGGDNRNIEDLHEDPQSVSEVDEVYGTGESVDGVETLGVGAV